MPEKMQELIDKVKRALFRLPLVLVAMLALLVACSIQAPITSTNLTPEEAYDLISQQQVTVLDVRIQEEYNSGHIPDALLLPVSELESRLNELNSSDHILVYCRSGYRSEEAAHISVANNFVHVYNLEGSVLQWQAQGFPVKVKSPCRLRFQ